MLGNLSRHSSHSLKPNDLKLGTEISSSSTESHIESLIFRDNSGGGGGGGGGI